MREELALAPEDVRELPAAEVAAWLSDMMPPARADDALTCPA